MKEANQCSNCGQQLVSEVNLLSSVSLIDNFLLHHQQYSGYDHKMEPISLLVPTALTLTEI